MLGKLQIRNNGRIKINHRFSEKTKKDEQQHNRLTIKSKSLKKSQNEPTGYATAQKTATQTFVLKDPQQPEKNTQTFYTISNNDIIDQNDVCPLPNI